MKRGLLATQGELADLAGRIGRKPFDHIHDRLRRRCGLILESKPITETMWRSLWQQGRWRAATGAAADIQGRVLDLIVAHKVDRNAAYRDRAIEELKNLLRFSTWVDPAHKGQLADLCTGEACATAAIALDWLAEELSEADRARCQRALREKGFRPYLKAVASGAFWYSAYHHWNAVVNAGVALAALLLSDEEDAASEALDAARTGLHGFFGALGREGGWDEGLGYWGYAMRYVLLLAEALARVSDDHSLYRRRGMDATGLFPVYFTPHGLPMSFGDRPQAPLWGTFYLLARRYGLKEVVWWLDRYALRHDVVTSGYSHAALALLFRPIDWPPEPAPDLHPIKAFNEIGWAAAADHWPLPDTYVALKTGDLAAHHAQLDMNSVQVMIDGHVVLHDPGSPNLSRDYLSAERRFGFYEARSVSHNTVTVGRREHQLDAVGSIADAQQGPRYRWLVGDAGVALGEDVRFRRHVVIPIGPRQTGSMVVVLDELANLAAEEIAATWHSGRRIALSKDGSGGRIDGEGLTVHFALGADVALRARTRARSLGSRRTDHVLTVSTPRVRQALMAAVFAPRELGKLRLAVSERAVLLAAGEVELHFRRTREHLKLQRVEGA